MFYVYEWYKKSNGEIFYVGKGTGRRYKVTKHNKFFDYIYRNFECESRIIKKFESESDAFCYEHERITELKRKGMCYCNISDGGSGGSISWWTEERRKEYSEKNTMKSANQRERMKIFNPMKSPEIAEKVAIKTRRKVVINNKTYESVKNAAKEIGVNDVTIISWCKRGYDTYGNPCRYFNEKQKEYSDIKKILPKATNIKPVIIDGKKFLTVKEGAAYIGCASETLIRSIKASRKCKGHTCKYDNQKPSQVNSDKSNLEGSTTNE